MAFSHKLYLMVRHLLLLLTIIVVFTREGHSQLQAVNEKLTLLDTTSKVSDEKFIYLQSFPNLGKIPYYFDKQQLAHIEKLRKAGDDRLLYPVLYDYVHHFGIQNFFKDNLLLWQLAKLEEARGDTLAAVSLYKSVLKHYHPELNYKLVHQKLDAFKEERKEDYVPLQYYYELVEYRKAIDTLRPPHGVYLNMGDGINSPDGDYGPALGASDSLLVFTSKRNKIERGMQQYDNEDLLISRREGDFWTPAEPLKGINSPYNEGSACISKDGKNIFFSRCNAPDGSGSCDLYFASRTEDGSWSKPQNLGPGVNSPHWDSHPSLSHQGDTLYFASDRLGGFGLSDIYYTYKDKSEAWTTPTNLGPVINTKGNEVSPFYHPGHHVLYFSSDGQLLNFGEFDIYKSSQGSYFWGEPKNIGPLVNGAGSEFYFTIDARSSQLYYARSVEESMKNLDLYSFPLPMEAQPLAYTKLKGSLHDEETGEPFSKGIVSIIDLDHGIEVAPKFLRPDGSFEFQLINNNNYLLVIQGDAFFRLEEIFYLDGDRDFHRKVAAISSRLEFKNMKFDNGKAGLKPEMYGDLDKVVDFLLDNPDFKLRIEGHTDSDGNADLNLALSQQRADAIKEYLVHFGSVDASRVEAIGYGSKKPIVAEEKTEEDKRMNRRVEFNIVKGGKD